MKPMNYYATRRLWRVAVLIAALAVPALAYAQNCALCCTQAAGAGSRMIAALKSGIVIPVIPPVLICIGLTVMAYKKRNQLNEE
jgi:CHASE2 domain-containing sensor protein